MCDHVLGTASAVPFGVYRSRALASEAGCFSTLVREFLFAWSSLRPNAQGLKPEVGRSSNGTSKLVP